MDLPKILQNNSKLLTQYKKIIINRAKYGPTRAYKNISPLTEAAIEHHFMDPSTGTLREIAALWISNAEPVIGQHGYDGKRNIFPIECKPRTWTFSLDKKSKNANGYGSINDHSWERHEKYIREHLIMQQSQFFDGICAWIIEFPYSYSNFVEHMEERLLKTSGRICGRFTYIDYWNCPGIRIPYINKQVIQKNKNNIVGGKFKKPKLFYEWIINQ